MQAEHEKVQTPNYNSFRSFRHHEKHFPFCWHFHPEYELTLITKGHGKRYIGDSIEDYVENDLTMVGGSLPHTWQSDSNHSSQQKAIVIQFPDTLFGTEDSHLTEFSNIRKLLALSIRGIAISPSSELLKKIDDLPNHKHLTRLIKLFDILETIYLENNFRLLASEGFNPVIAVKDKDKFDQIHHYLEENLEEKITLEETAKAHHMTTSTFSRFFKRTTGKTLIEYLNNLRIGKACSLLIDSKLSITEIAFQTGYSNLSHFNRMFLNLRSISPSEYRNHYRQVS